MSAQDRRQFLERLGTYLIGVALGFVVLGLFWQGHQRAARSSSAPPADPNSALSAPAPTRGGPETGAHAPSEQDDPPMGSNGSD